jgi:hypothetical protein
MDVPFIFPNEILTITEDPFDGHRGSLGILCGGPRDPCGGQSPVASLPVAPLPIRTTHRTLILLHWAGLPRQRRSSLPESKCVLLPLKLSVDQSNRTYDLKKHLFCHAPGSSVLGRTLNRVIGTWESPILGVQRRLRPSVDIPTPRTHTSNRVQNCAPGSTTT